MLRIIISSPQPMGGIDVSAHQDFIDEAIKDGHYPKPIFYLYGKVCKEMNYDKGMCLNGEDCSTKDGKYIEGVYDVHVMGYGNVCKAYLWNFGGIPRGLIVDPSIESDNAYAKKKYERKEKFL